MEEKQYKIYENDPIFKLMVEMGIVVVIKHPKAYYNDYFSYNSLKNYVDDKPKYKYHAIVNHVTINQKQYDFLKGIIDNMKSDKETIENNKTE